MPDAAAVAATLLVAVLLIFGVWRQFVILGPRGQIFDSLGIVPQWRFFAQSTLAARDDALEDHHLLIRMADGSSALQPWLEIFWDDERTWTEALWNPRMRAKGEVHLQMMLAALSGGAGHAEQFQSSLTYLTVLRYCLDHAGALKGHALQFAVVATAGRKDRPMSVKFVSAWHIP